MRNIGKNIILSGVFLYFFFYGTLAAKSQVRNDEQLIFNSGESSQQLRSVSETKVAIYKKDKKFEYANDPAYWTKQNTTTEYNTKEELDISMGLSFFKRTLFIIFFIALGIFLLWLIFNKGMKLFPGRKKNVIAINEQQGEEQDFEGLDHKIKTAVKAADYRMAVRFLYLKTIKGLGDKQMIPFSGTVTDGDFEKSLAETIYASDFRYLRNVYDYIWYGEFNINADQFESINHRFENFYASI